MNNLVIIPIIIPLLAGIISIFFLKHIVWQRWIGSVALIGTVLVSFYLLNQVYANGIQTLELGGWAPPFGIVLVADMLSALLTLTTSVIGLACFIYAFKSVGEGRERHFFYPVFLFLITGVIASFLTGDLFNLFVCFEVLLISSYVLISIGGTKPQLRESMKYILVNIVSSAFFVIGVAFLYAVTGTLNMADLSQRIADVGQTSFLTVLSIFLLIVFGIKAALFLYFWLPGSYRVPPPAVQAIFAALLTKVGIYAIIRIFTLIFYHQPDITHQLLAWLAALTMLLGVIGAVASWDVLKILAYNIVAAVGIVIFGLASFSATGLEGALFYLVHDMVIKAVLFLLAGAMISITGTTNLRKMGGLIVHHPILGWMFFIAAIALAGIPPLSGFIGKLLIIQGGIEAEHYWITGILLLSSLLILYSVIKIFMNGFWGEQKLSRDEEKGNTKGLLAPCAFLVAISIFWGVGAEWIYPYIEMATQTLTDPSIYIQSVLNIKE